MRAEDLMRSRMLADSIRARSADTSFEGRIYGSIILFVKQQILSCNTGRTINDPFLKKGPILVDHYKSDGIAVKVYGTVVD